MSWQPRTRDNAPAAFVGVHPDEVPKMKALIYGDATKYERESTGTLTISFAPDAALVTIVSKAYDVKAHVRLDTEVLRQLLDFLEVAVSNEELNWIKLEPRSKTSF